METNAVILIATLISAIGVVEPEVGMPCEEALAMVKAQGLNIDDVELTPEGAILHTMTQKQKSLFRDQIQAKVALVECRPMAGEI